MQKLSRESFAVVKARGVNPANYPDQSVFGTMPWPFLVIIIKLLSFTTPLKVAMQHSHIDGKEIKSYYFDLLKTASQLGVRTPVFDSIKDVMTKIDDQFRP